MEVDNFNILLADDDVDDCMLFKDALDELSLPASLNTVTDGVELIGILENNSTNLPCVLFLDLNMPRKSGFNCLSEIKRNKKLKQLPIVIYSTSYNPEVMDLLYANGAHYYIRKPANFTSLKFVLGKAITLIRQNRNLQPSKEQFVIQP